MPERSYATANGTSPASVFTVGAADRGPSQLTENTSTALVAAFVVTSRARPSGLNVTCPGVPVNGVAAVVPRPRLRVEPGIARDPAAGDPVAGQRAAAERVEHVRVVPVHGHADRELAARPDDLAQPELVAGDP